MLNSKSTMAIITTITLLSGCSSVNNSLAQKKKNVELYRIFNIQTDADRYLVAEAASNGLGANVGSAIEENPIPNYSERPSKPGRYRSVDPAKDMGQLGGFAALAASQLSGSLSQLKVADCDGAIWTARAKKHADDAFDMSFNLCLWEYKGGYHLDVYANYTKEEGGFYQAIRSASYALVGTPEEWAEKTVLDVVREIKTETGATIKINEGHPKLNTTPWIDSGMVFNSEGYLAEPEITQTSSISTGK